MRRHLSHAGVLILSLLFLIILGLPLVVSGLSGSPRIDQQVTSPYTNEHFVQRLLPVAQELAQNYGIKTSILLGQALLGSQSGSGLLAVHYYNIYGIQTTQRWNSVILGDSSGNVQRYLTYSSWQGAMEDYVALLKSGYFGKNLYKNIVTHTSIADIAQYIAESSYTTDSDYATKLVDIISRYNLTQYD